MNVLAVVRFRTFLRKELMVWGLTLGAALGPMAPAHADVAVGRIGGFGSVSATGGATYTIPIEVVAGMNGLKPDVALTYDSQSGDGLAGVGWTLSGFSKIYRCPRTRPLDGDFAGGVTYSTTDRFCLDGAPLVQISGGTYGDANMEYRAEVHGYEKVVSKGMQGTGPSYFEVSLPNGLTYLYGNDTDSRMLAPGTSSEVRVWALNTIEDKFGNQINFHYTSPETGEYVPDEITWTSNGGSTAPYKLAFTYEDLPQSALRSGYVWGSQWQATQRLQTIEYFFNDTLVHRYTLSYDNSSSTGKSRLQSVEQCNDDSDCLQKTTLDWQDGAVGFGSEQAGPTVENHYKAAFGDVNGDGATDVYVPLAGVWHVMYANPATGTFNSPVSLNKTYYGSLAGIALDYDGDGRTDLMAQGPDGNLHVYLAAAASSHPDCTSAGDCDTGVAVTGIAFVSSMEVNGDGLSDLVYVGSNISVSYRLNNGSSLGEELNTSVVMVLLPFDAKNIGDVDGDGRQDIIATTTPFCGWDGWSVSCSGMGVMVYRTDWTGSYDFTPVSMPTSSAIWYEAIPIVIDVNGDGLSDVLYNSENGNVYLSVSTVQSSFRNSDRFFQRFLIEGDRRRL